MTDIAASSSPHRGTFDAGPRSRRRSRAGERDRADVGIRGLWHRILGLLRQLESMEDDGPVSKVHY